MLREREVVTLGFGNYGTLVAAQWANGTSRYDANHSTLYRERCRDSVYGVGAEGDADGSGGEGARRVRVPRLLVFDAPHASYFVTLPARRARARDCRAATECQAATEAADDDQPSHRRRHHDPNEDSDSDSEHDADALVAEARHRWLRDGYAAPHSTAKTNADAEDKDKDDDDDEDTASLFALDDTAVPWWRYITTGVDVDSVTSLRPLQLRDTAGDVPALHSVGYGLSRLCGATSDEVATLCEALRRQVEDCDSLQGIQCFVDGDTLFAGVAHNVLRDASDELVGAQLPMVAFTAFVPLPPALSSVQASLSSSAAAGGCSSSNNNNSVDDDEDEHAATPFVQRRRDEVALNRLLATSTLSRHRSLLYIPLDLCRWPRAFAPACDGACAASSLSWLRDDTATAQYIAAVADTALYGLRDGVSSSSSSSSPAYYMHEWCSAVRPVSSLRVAAMNGALPLPHDDGRAGAVASRTAATTTTTRANARLQSVLQRMPLLPCDDNNDSSDTHIHMQQQQQQQQQCGGFVPLSHELRCAATSEAGRVLGHAVTLRGVAATASSSGTHSNSSCIDDNNNSSSSGSRVGSDVREVMWRYAQRLHTSSYLPLLTHSSYPVSRTFPQSLLLAHQQQQQHDTTTAASLSAATAMTTPSPHSVGVGAHVMTTYATAPMLRRTVRAAQAVLHRRMHVYSDVYDMHKDDWREHCEEVLQLYDDYHHEHSEDDGDDDD